MATRGGREGRRSSRSRSSQCVTGSCRRHRTEWACTRASGRGRCGPIEGEVGGDGRLGRWSGAASRWLWGVGGARGGWFGGAGIVVDVLSVLMLWTCFLFLCSAQVPVASTTNVTERGPVLPTRISGLLAAGRSRVRTRSRDRCDMVDRTARGAGGLRPC